jgi:hypothetical protein
MRDERTDRIAREAARLMALGKVEGITQAIQAAVDRLGLVTAPRPGHVLVRRHARGMAMQALGDVGYANSVADILGRAEELMTLIEHGLEDAWTVLVGRAAKGQVDAGVTLYLRVYTRRPLRDIVELTVDCGYEEPAFETAHTKLGRLDRIRFVDEGVPVVITRCLPEMKSSHQHDLMTGRPMATLDLVALRRQLAE